MRFRPAQWFVTRIAPNQSLQSLFVMRCQNSPNLQCACGKWFALLDWVEVPDVWSYGWHLLALVRERVRESPFRKEALHALDLVLASQESQDVARFLLAVQLQDGHQGCINIALLRLHCVEDFNRVLPSLP